MTKHSWAFWSTGRFLGPLLVVLLGTAAPARADLILEQGGLGYIEALNQKNWPSFETTQRRVEGGTDRSVGGLRLPSGTLSLDGSSLTSSGSLMSWVDPLEAVIIKDAAFTYTVTDPMLALTALLQLSTYQLVHIAPPPDPRVTETHSAGVSGFIAGTVAPGQIARVYYQALITYGGVHRYFDFTQLWEFEGGESGLSIYQPFDAGGPLPDAGPFGYGVAMSLYASIQVFGENPGGLPGPAVGTTEILLDPGFGVFTAQTGPSAVPEPSSLILGGIGIVGLAVSASWRKQRKHPR